jgi:outer membrane protein assembly factor BamA
MILLLPSCTSMIAKKDLPFPLTNENFGDRVKVVTIPLPAVAATPNEGVTYGGLTPFLLHNRKDEVDTLIAPQLYYNPNFGVTGTVFGSFYLSPERNGEINLSRSAKVNEDYELKVRDKTLLGKKLEIRAFLYGFTDGSARFFGFQSNSSSGDETNYGDREAGITLSAGYDVTDHVQFVVTQRYRHVNIVPGAITKLPFLRDRFTAAQVPGIDGFTTHAVGLSVVYSTVDSRDFPTRGVYARVSVEASQRFLGSSANFQHYDLEAKGYLPLREDRFVGVARVEYNQTLGGGVPFLERSVLGGENTLRGYGRGRFIDSSYLLLNVEERIRLFRWNVFHVNADWYVVPFLDVGSVMKALDRIDRRAFEYNPGVGFRATVRPNIVGRVDIGWGKEGPSVFVGLGYPF